MGGVVMLVWSVLEGVQKGESLRQDLFKALLV